MRKNEKLTVVAVFRALEKAYHPPRTFLSWKTPLDLLVATILSARCTDSRVNVVTKTLYGKYRRPEDYIAVSRKEMEKGIRSCGTYRNKARFIREMCRQLVDRHSGKVPRTMDELVQLRGVGRKTAAIVLWACFGRNEGIAVDTHVMRLSRRLGLSRNKNPGKIELDLMKSLPRKHWGELNALMISHGRAICTARNRQCPKCQFWQKCPSSSKLGKNDLAKA